MLAFVGVVLFLIGLVSFVLLLVYGYREFSKDETKKSKKLFFLILGLLDIFTPSSLSGFALILSIVAILFGIVFITGSYR